MAEGENQHKGHRQRMLKKFLTYGIECFEEHELLEILLFSVFPRRNTNDIAHELIRRFGSIEGVLAAEFDELCEVENIGPNAAAMLRFYSEFLLKYRSDGNIETDLSDSNVACDYCYKLLRNTSVEVGYALFLDDSLFLLSKLRLAQGIVSNVDFDLKQVVKTAVELKSTKIILVHNHPSGVSAPSMHDVAATRRMWNTLTSIGMTLVDHIVVNYDGASSMRNMQLLPDLWGRAESPFKETEV